MRIALTGGIACGKSLVARYLNELGVETIDADDVVHTLIPAEERRRLAAVVFKDPSARRELEARIHPIVKARIWDFLENSRRSDILVASKHPSPSRRSDVPVASSSPNLYFDPNNRRGLTRANLPHWDQGEKMYFITFRLNDSLPSGTVERIRAERDEWIAQHPRPWDDDTAHEYVLRFSDTLEQKLDAGYGTCVLRNQWARDIVESALLFQHGRTCELFAFVVMPNHVHVLLRLFPDISLQKLLKDVKSWTAHMINRQIGGQGALWEKESWDRVVRSPKQLIRIKQYIVENPKCISGLSAWCNPRSDIPDSRRSDVPVASDGDSQSSVRSDEDVASPAMPPAGHIAHSSAGEATSPSLPNPPPPSSLRIAIIPLLFETHWDSEYDIICTVRSSRETQITRMMTTRGYTRDEAEARMAAQMPVEEKAAKSNYVIDNDGSAEELKTKVEKFVSWLKNSMCSPAR